MTDRPQIEVIIGRDGKVRVEVNGVKGAACLSLTQGIEQALGGQVETRKQKAEIYAVEVEMVSNEVRVATGLDK